MGGEITSKESDILLIQNLDKNIDELKREYSKQINMSLDELNKSELSNLKKAIVYFLKLLQEAQNITKYDQFPDAYKNIKTYEKNILDLYWKTNEPDNKEDRTLISILLMYIYELCVGLLYKELTVENIPNEWSEVNKELYNKVLKNNDYWNHSWIVKIFDSLFGNKELENKWVQLAMMDASGKKKAMPVIPIPGTSLSDS